MYGKTAAGFGILLILFACLGGSILSLGAVGSGNFNAARQEAIRMEASQERAEAQQALLDKNLTDDATRPSRINAAKRWQETKSIALIIIAGAVCLGISGVGFFFFWRGFTTPARDKEERTRLSLEAHVICAPDGNDTVVGAEAGYATRFLPPGKDGESQYWVELDVQGAQRTQAQIGAAQAIGGALAAGSPQAEPTGRSMIYNVTEWIAAPFQGPATQIVPLGRRLPPGPVRPQDEDAVLNSLGPQFDQALGHASGVEIVDEGGE